MIYGGDKLAESIAIHFKDAAWDAVTEFLNHIAERGAPRLWFYPGKDNYVITLYEYDDLLEEYENNEVEKLLDTLGDFPTATLCLELRRSQGDKAVNGATALCCQLLNKFDGIVDDLAPESELWTLDQICSSEQTTRKNFLSSYKKVDGTLTVA